MSWFLCLCSIPARIYTSDRTCEDTEMPWVYDLVVILMTLTSSNLFGTCVTRVHCC